MLPAFQLKWRYKCISSWNSPLTLFGDLQHGDDSLIKLNEQITWEPGPLLAYFHPGSVCRMQQNNDEAKLK